MIALSGRYPIILNIQDRLCLVVGGGKVAERKVLSLLDCGAAVRLVSPEITGELRRLVKEGRIHFIEGCYSKDYLESVFLVISAAGDKEVNRRVATDCMERGLLVNAVDDPRNSNFYVPAVVRRGPLQIAVSTGGKSPMLARKIKEQLEEIFSGEFGSVVNMIGGVREKIIRETSDPEEKEMLLSSLLDDTTMELLREGKFDQVKERINNAYLGGGS
jgi:precorrin-2 dehydrogenase/sirohydrochlorin ferrochelatase